MTDKLYIVTSAQLEEWFPKSHEIFESEEYGFCGECAHASDILECKNPEIRSFMQNNTQVDFLVTSDFGCNRWKDKV